MLYMLRELYLLPVRIYQVSFSLAVGDCCRFQPSCSRYFVQAVHTHGIFKGSLMGAWRVWRCNPFNDGGPDPVPPKKKRGELIPPARVAPPEYFRSVWLYLSAGLTAAGGGLVTFYACLREPTGSGELTSSAAYRIFFWAESLFVPFFAPPAAKVFVNVITSLLWALGLGILFLSARYRFSQDLTLNEKAEPAES